MNEGNQVENELRAVPVDPPREGTLADAMGEREARAFLAENRRGPR